MLDRQHGCRGAAGATRRGPPRTEAEDWCHPLVRRLSGTAKGILLYPDLIRPRRSQPRPTATIPAGRRVPGFGWRLAAGLGCAGRCGLMATWYSSR